MDLIYKGLTMLFEMKELYVLELSVLMISSYHIPKMFQIAYSIYYNKFNGRSTRVIFRDIISKPTI